VSITIDKVLVGCVEAKVRIWLAKGLPNKYVFVIKKIKQKIRREEGKKEVGSTNFEYWCENLVGR
jgi:hypothetical protein